MTISVQLSPDALATIQKFKGAEIFVPQAIRRGMDRALQIVSGRIQEKRLTGRGPFPVEEHRLGERTGQLKLRTRATRAEVISENNPVAVSGAIGSSVKYAAVHEFGGATGRNHKSVMPERAPFTTGINENLSYISGEIEKEIMASLKS